MHNENIYGQYYFYAVILQVVGCRGRTEIAPRVAMVNEITVHGVFLGRSSDVRICCCFCLFSMPPAAISRRQEALCFQVCHPAVIGVVSISLLTLHFV